MVYHTNRQAAIRNGSMVILSKGSGLWSAKAAKAMNVQIAIARLPIIASLLAAAPVTPVAEDWPAVSPEELKLTAPRVGKNAGAEAILEEIRQSGEGLVSSSTVLSHYIRIKILSEQAAREAAAARHY